MAKNLTDKQTQELALASFEEDAGIGTEDMSKDDLVLPFLRVAQKMSPILDEDDGQYNPEAKVGMFYNTATGKLYNSVRVVPVYYSRTALEWAPNGGGFVAEHPITILDTLERNDKGKYLKGENVVDDTRQHYVFIVNEDGSYDPALLSLSSTGIKTSRNWNTMMRNLKIQGANGSFNPPIFSQIYGLTTVSQSNDFGTWKAIHVAHEGSITTPELYTEVKQAHDSFAAGEAKVDYNENVDKKESSSEEY